MKANYISGLFVSFLLISSLAHGENGTAPETAVDLLKKIEGKISWAELLSDKAPGTTSASSMLGISGESISPIENVRDVIVSLTGLSSGGSKTTFGVAVTPARSALAPMDLSTYASRWYWRALGSTTAGYAQGDATIEGKQFERRAISVETSFFFHRKDDPILAFADRIVAETKAAKGKPAEDATKNLPCAAIIQTRKPPGSPGDALKLTTPKQALGEDPESEDAARSPGEVSPSETEEFKKRAASCKDAARKALRWNGSRAYASLATGWIKPSDGSFQQETLGQSVVAGATYGFDGIKAMRLDERAALSLAWRKTWDEPVLSSLVSGLVQQEDSSLFFLRLTGGSDSFRALIEGSNAKGDSITASQRAFRAALGIDVRVYEGLWINLRVGSQKTISGSDTELGSLLTVSYSPTAFLTGR